MIITVRTRVASGLGLAKKLRCKEIEYLSDLIGSDLVKGSLNLVADKPLWLNNKTVIYSTEEGHMYWQAVMNGVPVIVNRWRGDCPAHIYEIYATTMLRSELGLVDGDIVCLDLDKRIVDLNTTKNIKHIVTWYLIWFFRKHLYYRSNKYLHWLKSSWIKGYIWRAFQM
jgi:hypothetical protein